MATNKIAILIENKTNRTCLLLAYAVLEWILIALLLLDGVLSHLISKFASFFGLPPPCILCSRLGVDRLLDGDIHTNPQDSRACVPYRRLLCNEHASEVSGLGYCGAHQRLADAGDMCEECTASKKAPAAMSWMRRSELGEKDLRCACCEVQLESGFFSPSFALLKPSLKVLEVGAKEKERSKLSSEGDARTGFKAEDAEEKREEEGMTITELFDWKPFIAREDASANADDERLAPLATIDEMAVASIVADDPSSCRVGGEEDEHDVVGVFSEKEKMLSDLDAKKVDAVVNRAIDDLTAASVEQGIARQLPYEGDSKLKVVDSVYEIPIGKEIAKQEQVEQVEQEQEPNSLMLDAGKWPGEACNETTTMNQGSLKLNETIFLSFNNISPEMYESSLQTLSHIYPHTNDFEVEQTPETQTHIEGISDLPKIVMPKTKDSSSESVDGSEDAIPLELEGSEPLPVDQLKSALIAARNSLNSLYSELEDERNAAAIAADETMAMINRLQEQKAAMQLESVQYQRLMEEQSEYDQEALQRLNELVLKREKEKQELKKELELYRQKVHIYEAKQKRRIARRKAYDQNGSSSASSSAEDSDDLSPSFYEGDVSAHCLKGISGSTLDGVLPETAKHLITLEDSLADFKLERFSILDELKALEERLFELEDEGSETVKMDEHFSEEKHVNGTANGFSHSSYRGKRLLPLFDAVSLENGNDLAELQDPCEIDGSPKALSKLVKEQEKLAIADEVDHVYERLQALEADAEFLKHCIKSVNKGGKGLDLLQEILHHLRDLRRVELQARNAGAVSPYFLHT